MLRRLILAAAVTAALTAGPALAQTAPPIVQQWATVPVPAPPPLKPVTIDATTTALLNLDWLRQVVTGHERPTAALPAATKLLATARAHKLFVVHSRFPGPAPADAVAPTAPLPGEPSVVGLPDKFLNTDLDQQLKAKGIKTVIVTGVTAEGAVLNTAAHAAGLGYNVIVPVDTMPSDIAPYGEQAVVWLFSVIPVYSAKITLTATDRMTF